MNSRVLFNALETKIFPFIADLVFDGSNQNGSRRMLSLM